jgi:uncharacterized protein GlcG (DUF336 family)/DNA-binding winged helix-turn-helix (wHTH) protein
MDARCFSFGPFLLIPQRQALLRGESPVRIGSRALDILTQLVQRPGEVIDKQELIALVWAGTFVDENNLKVNIAAIRKTIDCDAANGSYIATVVGRGYRFVEPVQEVSLDGLGLFKWHHTLSEYAKPLTVADRIIDSLTEQLNARRLVTVVRAFSIGKNLVASVTARNTVERSEAKAQFVQRSSVVQAACDGGDLTNKRGGNMPRQYTTLTLAEAKQILSGAEARAESLGIAYNIAVVDAGGHLLAFSRQDGALIGSIELAIDKASTARIFDKATSSLATLAQSGKPLFGIQESNDGKVVIFGGGIPIMFDGNIIGAVGASAGTVEQDIAVAEAGAAALSISIDHPNRQFDFETQSR